ncbi:hypothetical protein VOLCADRAFT_87737 [Volvox carteri f. nagariensis]|uniref:Uncharacterized protein n=1 Tax=Volvox carteri f. nagariensis TaxID=3068 RepID=D8TM42_VOLCA|nr:uncharacterized protein VOLCADRAFT_87737 [Volvox carteri f. nagariensis]EFJ51576.1 hypothetical protein VOLCADRAFT_87737 [Volvox carteri f. nagariensis]|eukprot:XP_002947528.1 hypothetical protein VOLCADRAFT_87737 [Volvox carteri f. nagariensis]
MATVRLLSLLVLAFLCQEGALAANVTSSKPPLPSNKQPLSPPPSTLPSNKQPVSPPPSTLPSNKQPVSPPPSTLPSNEHPLPPPPASNNQPPVLMASVLMAADCPLYWIHMLRYVAKTFLEKWA